MEFKVLDLGLADFTAALEAQQQAFRQVKSGQINSALVLCRHRPVITLGRLSDKRNILASPAELTAKGITVYAIERGGDVTYHGPGQITAYPIFNLECLKKDLHWFLRQLECVAIALLEEFGINASQRKGITGVWVLGRKIASLGIAVRNWITFHGISLNIKEDDLANFNLIRPCGMDTEMVAMENLLSRDVSVEAVKDKLVQQFYRYF